MPSRARRWSRRDRPNRIARAQHCHDGPWLTPSRPYRSYGAVVPLGTTTPVMSGRGGHGIDDRAHFADLGGGEPAQARVLPHRLFSIGEIDAERLVVDDVRVHPLRASGELVEGFVGRCGDVRILLA